MIDKAQSSAALWRCDRCGFVGKDGLDLPPSRCPVCWHPGSVRRVG